MSASRRNLQQPRICLRVKLSWRLYISLLMPQELLSRCSQPMLSCRHCLAARSHFAGAAATGWSLSQIWLQLQPGVPAKMAAATAKLLTHYFKCMIRYSALRSGECTVKRLARAAPAPQCRQVRSPKLQPWLFTCPPSEIAPLQRCQPSLASSWQLDALPDHWETPQHPLDS